MLYVLGIILLLVHIFLFAWSLGGMLEWSLQSVPWKPYSNPEFPRWLLFFHWASVLFASGAFIYGYAVRWPHTPYAMLIGYLLMAMVCVVETFGYMTSPYRYLAMTAEFATYIGILILLFSLSFRELHFPAT